MICKRRLSDTWRTRDGASGFAAGSRWWLRELRMQEKVAFLTNSVREPVGHTLTYSQRIKLSCTKNIFNIYFDGESGKKISVISEVRGSLCCVPSSTRNLVFPSHQRFLASVWKGAKVSDGSIRFIQCSIRNDFKELQHIWCKHQRGVRDEPITAQRHCDHSEHVCEWKRGQLGYILYPEVNVQLHCDISMVIYLKP